MQLSGLNGNFRAKMTELMHPERLYITGLLITAIFLAENKLKSAKIIVGEIQLEWNEN